MLSSPPDTHEVHDQALVFYDTEEGRKRRERYREEIDQPELECVANNLCPLPNPHGNDNINDTADKSPWPKICTVFHMSVLSGGTVK